MWIYQTKAINTIEELPDSEALCGFVYCVKNTINGRTYYGKKSFYSTLKKSLGKKELKTVTDKRLKTYKKVTKESNWKSYWGTVNPKEELVSDLDVYGMVNFTRTIIALAYSKKELTFLELEHQVFNNVLRDEKSYNSNILGKFFRKDLTRA